MTEAELASVTWWAWFWGEIEHWSFLAVVVFLAIEFAALKFGAPLKEKIENERELQLEKLKNENLRLRVEIAPRELSPQQKELIASSLKKFAGRPVTVSTYALDVEAMRFASSIMQALDKAGIPYSDSRGSLMLDGPRLNKFGIEVSNPNSASDIEYGSALAVALDAAGAGGKFDVKYVPDIYPPYVLIFVGMKPFPKASP